MALERHWIRQFALDQEDVEFLTNMMLETEVPMTGKAIALVLIKRQLEEQRKIFRRRFENARVYNPSLSFEPEQRVIFPAFNFATASVLKVRQGENPDYGVFRVIAVEFDDEALNSAEGLREFAVELNMPHKLNDPSEAQQELARLADQDSEDVLKQAQAEIIERVESGLLASDDLLQIAQYWFPRALVLDVDIGSLHLAEAVIDMAGRPLTTKEILSQIGGIGDVSEQLQRFSLNFAMSRDDRFDEVGPSGEVLWYLKRLEPREAREIPKELRYQPAQYEADLLSPELLDLEEEIQDELTLHLESDPQDEVVVTLTYPHRKAGTFPLNAASRHVFPTGRTPRIWIELVDANDGTNYTGWVVHQHRFVAGFEAYYSKHRLPVGAYVIARRGEEPGQIIIDHRGRRPRTEWVRLVSPDAKEIRFENKKRAIGAEYEDLMLVGVDDLEAVEALADKVRSEEWNLALILRKVLRELSKLSPQGAVHAKTLYSAVNVFRRCPPGPIFATLAANPDFERVGDVYWRLSD